MDRINIEYGDGMMYGGNPDKPEGFEVLQTQQQGGVPKDSSWAQIPGRTDKFVPSDTTKPMGIPGSSEWKKAGSPHFITPEGKKVPMPSNAGLPNPPKSPPKAFTPTTPRKPKEDPFLFGEDE